MQMPFSLAQKFVCYLMCVTCVLLVCYVAKFGASADYSHQRKPLKNQCFLELPSVRRFLHGDSNHRIFKVFQPFCCLCVAYSANFLACERFSLLILIYISCPRSFIKEIKSSGSIALTIPCR